MTTTIKIHVSDTTAEAARAAGLLQSETMDRLLNEALARRRAGDTLLEIAERVRKADIAPMTMNEINAEVKAARAERKRADRH